MKEQLLRVMNNPRRPIAIAGVTAFAAGSAVGYFLGRRKTSGAYGVHEIPAQLAFDVDRSNVDDRRDEEPAAVIEAEAYDQITEGRQFVSDKLADLELREITLDPSADGDVRLVEPVTENVFAGNDDTWDFEAELARRSTNEPYVIHKDEYFEVEDDYSQVTLTYYEGDNIMAAEDDTPVYNYDRVVGELKFGHGSGGDPNVFYVRNDKLRAEYEILRHEGHFAVEVEGLDPSDSERRTIRHSADRFPKDD